MLNRLSYIFVGLAALAAVAPLANAEDDISRPCRRLILSFPRPGTISQVYVEDGDVVKEGQLLLEQDFAPEEAQLRGLNREADDDTRVRYAAVALAQSKLELERNVGLYLWKAEDGAHVQMSKVKEGLEVLDKGGIESLAALRGDKEGDENFAGPGAVSALEVEHALLDAKLKQASLQVAQLEHDGAKDNRDQMKASIEQMKIISPINGRVERILLRKGESADALKEVILLIQTDPLWLEVSVPMDKARLLGVGQKAAVQFPQEVMGVSTPRPAEQSIGKIVFKSGMANQAGQLMVRVEVPNPHNRPAGEQVKIQFDATSTMRTLNVAPATMPAPTAAAAQPRPSRALRAGPFLAIHGGDCF